MRTKDEQKALRPTHLWDYPNIPHATPPNKRGRGVSWAQTVNVHILNEKGKRFLPHSRDGICLVWVGSRRSLWHKNAAHHFNNTASHSQRGSRSAHEGTHQGHFSRRISHGGKHSWASSGGAERKFKPPPSTFGEKTLFSYPNKKIGVRNRSGRATNCNDNPAKGVSPLAMNRQRGKNMETPDLRFIVTFVICLTRGR